MNKAISVGTVDSAVGHLVGSTTWNHYFWTTSFFSDTFNVPPNFRVVNFPQASFRKKIQAAISSVALRIADRCLDVENHLKCMDTDTSGVHLWLVLMKAYAALERVAVESIANTGICLTDFKILEILLHRGALPVNTLAVRVDLTSGSATAAIDRLTARGLVERKASEHDRRERVVHATEAGLALASSAFETHSRVMEAAAKVLDESDRLQLIGLLRRFGKEATNASRNS